MFAVSLKEIAVRPDMLKEGWSYFTLARNSKVCRDILSIIEEEFLWSNVIDAAEKHA